MQDWYKANIEPGVCNLVRYLRNQGFNTVSSCEHQMFVHIMLEPDELRALWEHLLEFHRGDAHAFELQFYWHGQHKYADIRLRLRNGKPNPSWSGRRDWAGNLYETSG